MNCSENKNRFFSKGAEKSALVLMIMMLLISVVFSGCDLGDFQKRVVDPSGAVASAEYSAVFEDTGIDHKVTVKGENTVSYAMVDEDGFVYCQDYAYNGDTIKEWKITDYIPVHGFDDELMAQMEEACESDLEAYQGYDCVKANYSQEGDYIVFVVNFTDVDNENTLKTLKELEFVDSYDGYLSMEECEKVDLSDGYVKK